MTNIASERSRSVTYEVLLHCNKEKYYLKRKWAKYTHRQFTKRKANDNKNAF